MDTSDIDKRLKQNAIKDRIKMFIAMSLMLALILALQNLALPALARTSFVVALFVCAAVLALRLVRKLESDSFGEGVHLVMESVPMPTFLLDDKNNIVYCNEETPGLYGFKNRKEYYTKFYSLVPKFQSDGRRPQDTLNAHIQTALNSGAVIFDWTQQKLDGQALPTKVTLVLAHFESRNYIIGFIEDLRESLELRKQDKIMKEMMQGLLDSAPLPCAIYDNEFNVIKVNKGAEALFNIPDRQIFLDNFSDFVPHRQPDGSDSLEKTTELLRQTLRDGFLRCEFMYQTKDGTPIPTEEVLNRVALGGRDHVIVYTRDLREIYASRAAEQRTQKRLNDMMELLNNQLESQSSAITQSSSAIEEMIANIRSVSETLSKNAENVKTLKESSVVGHSSLNEVAADIRGIAEESESLLEINSVMRNIASQTNLLSMNAAIEAAHAGNSGKGFAVVADEIRKLAENSSQQSKIIGTVLKKIKESIDKITRSTESVMNKFSAIEDSVKIVAEQEGNIFNAMTEQGAGSNEILQAIAQVNDITSQVKADARKLVEAAAKLGAD